MPGRGFGYITIPSGVAPLVATTLQTGVQIVPGQTQTVLVGSTTLFQNNDTVNIIPAATNGPAAETALQIQVLSATSISAAFLRGHAAGDFVVLRWPCGNVTVQQSGVTTLTASCFIGGSPLLTTAGAYALWDVRVATFQSCMMGMGHCDDTANYWISGNGTGQVLVGAITQ